MDERPPGDPDLTHACVERLRVGWAPATPLASGLAAQVAFHRSLRLASGQVSGRAPMASGSVAS